MNCLLVRDPGCNRNSHRKKQQQQFFRKLQKPNCCPGSPTISPLVFVWFLPPASSSSRRSEWQLGQQPSSSSLGTAGNAGIRAVFIYLLTVPSWCDEWLWVDDDKQAAEEMEHGGGTLLEPISESTRPVFCCCFFLVSFFQPCGQRQEMRVALYIISHTHLTTFAMAVTVSVGRTSGRLLHLHLPPLLHLPPPHNPFNCGNFHLTRLHQLLRLTQPVTEANREEI